MDNGEIDRQLNELWRKASGKDYAPDTSFHPAHFSDAQAETVQFLKNNFSRAENDWRRLLEAKETNIRALSAQLEETRAHLSELKQRCQEAGEKLVNEELASALKLEESGKILNAQKKNHAREILLLKEILERTKAEMTSLGERIDALRAERDAWQKKFTEAEIGHANMKDASAGAERRLAEAREAVERTLSELLAERRARTDSEKKVKDSEKKAADLEARLADARANWDAERKEWRELWDRERSVWETHRQEFAVWESRLRSEREAWTAKLKEEETKGLDYAAGLANTLKESSEWSEKVTQILKLYALKGVQLPSVFVSPEKVSGAAPAARVRRSVTKLAAMTLAGIILLGGLAWRVYDYRTKVHFTLLGRTALDTPNAAGLSFSKDGVWLADWESGLVLKDAKDFATLRVFKGEGAEPFRPAAVSAFEGGVWALDLAQLRFIRRDINSGKVTESVKTPGPAPQGAAWDGANLWSFDAATGLLYRYGLDPAGGVEASYTLQGLKSLADMQWVGGEFWALDAKGSLRRYLPEEGSFRLLSEQKLKHPAAAFWAGPAVLDKAMGQKGGKGDGYFWTLEKSGGAGGLSAVKYKYRKY